MIQLSDATFIVNNEAVATVPNSIKFSEGLGEQKVKAASVGNGEVEPVYSHDLESSFSMASADFPSTPENIEKIRSWKLKRNTNVVQIIGETLDGTMTRTFARCAIINNYEVSIGSDAVISVEFHGMRAV